MQPKVPDIDPNTLKPLPPPDVAATVKQLASGELFYNWGYILQDLLYKAAWAFLIFLFFWFVSKVVVRLIHKTVDKTGKSGSGAHQLLEKTAKLFIFSFGLVTALGQFINITPLLAGLGVVGLAVGFAAQDTIKNFIAGITILIDQPFRVGDNIVLEGKYGVVHEITLRSTRIKTVNNEIMVLPNDQMINGKVINHSMMGLLRLEIPFSIGYNESSAEAREVALQIAAADARLEKDPAPSVIVTAMADSGISLMLRVWIRNMAHEVPLRGDLNEALLRTLQEKGIEIPYPAIIIRS
ncbi:MAG: mechanosensitive ion channel family protein [Bacteroidetes Order II. Incertae sedis bacterium]|nr:mechanosensitive ion channel family protein [Bacteroidetes Order II. bacterium]